MGLLLLLKYYYPCNKMITYYKAINSYCSVLYSLKNGRLHVILIPCVFAISLSTVKTVILSLIPDYYYSIYVMDMQVF